MADVGGAPGFGQVDLDIEDEPEVAARPPAPAPPSSGRAFGEVDLDLGDAQADEAPPPSTSRVFGPAKSTSGATRVARSKKPTEKTVARAISLEEAAYAADAGCEADADEAAPVSVHDEHTRIVSGEGLSALTDAPPSTRSSGPRPAPSSTGVEPRGDGRVAAMRNLYARGDADGALALGASLGERMPPHAPAGDHPDASVVIELGEQSIDLVDPFGGLIPMDDDVASTATVVPPAHVGSSITTAPPAFSTAPPAAHLTLTERQSIPRLLKSMSEVSKLKIDHRAGFLLAHVDGMHTLEEILDICAMPSAEALALIAGLKDMGVIEFE